VEFPQSLAAASSLPSLDSIFLIYIYRYVYIYIFEFAMISRATCYLSRFMSHDTSVEILPAVHGILDKILY
jgi:hypothetical protein